MNIDERSNESFDGFMTIESHELDAVTGAGRFDTLRRAGSWAWKQADRAVTALGIADLGSRAYDWATGGNSGGNNGGAQPPSSAPESTPPMQQPGESAGGEGVP